jgi:superfamily II DNA or RNA helicase/HKD family nuclease
VPLIDNRAQTMQQALKNALTDADRVDVSVGYFYFSGFEALSEDLKDKQVRILVGMEVDPACIPDIVQFSREADEDLSRWQPRKPTRSSLGLRQNYTDALVGFLNDSDTFDFPKADSAFGLFVEKLENGTLEIRKTLADEHGKYYLIHNRTESSHNGDFPGTVFSGSSNMTYRGLVGQGELNDSYRDKAKFEEYFHRFEEMWDPTKSVAIADQHNRNDFLKELKSRVWKYYTPSPHEMYLRVLHEVFNHEEEEAILSPSTITAGRFLDLKYQLDAIRMGLDRLAKFDGVIVADVVGLGKSIIASCIARNLDMNAVIVSPPHLIPQWEDYKEQFGIRGSRVFSSGNIAQVHERYENTAEPILLILDEAHRYRNEDTNDYKLLHQVCRGNPNNKIVILTATPFNNAPKDIFALIKLFQTPGQATIRSVDNLSLRFRELIDRYTALRRAMTKGLKQVEIEREAEEIAAEQRRLIESVVIRRSRVDLKRIKRYREDLERQGIEFSEVIGPELMEYDLGGLLDLYLETLETISASDIGEGFIGARYKPAVYITDREAFLKRFGADLDETDLRTAQANLADFMRKLLVMRFESSKYAFESTLNKMIQTNQLVERWWVELGRIPIMKKGLIPDPYDMSEYDEDDGEGHAGLEEELDELKRERGLIAVPKDLIDDKFIEDVRKDTALLVSIRSKWFDDPAISAEDPKTDDLARRISDLLAENPQRKIIVFSSYADTVNYLSEQLCKRGIDRLFHYTAADATTATRKIVTANFDASLPADRQANDFDVLIATDALSEGYNLNRAGVVINYDIPYNPTRVIQRVGRINRINKKVFNELHIFNSFPTAIGEAETRVKQISTLKMKLINAIVGSDTKTLTDDEQIQSFFKDEYDEAESLMETASWDAVHRDAYFKALEDGETMSAAMKIPRRSRIQRREQPNTAVVVFGKKGDQSIFTVAERDLEPLVVSAERAVPMFAATSSEQGFEVQDRFVPIFNKAKEKLFAKNPMPAIKGRRQDAIKNLMAIKAALPASESYCSDLIKVIKEFDDVSEGTLKDIVQLDMRNVEAAFSSLQDLVSVQFIRNVIDRAHRADEGQELLLLAEELLT